MTGEDNILEKIFQTKTKDSKIWLDEKAVVKDLENFEIFKHDLVQYDSGDTTMKETSGIAERNTVGSYTTLFGHPSLFLQKQNQCNAIYLSNVHVERLDVPSSFLDPNDWYISVWEHSAILTFINKEMNILLSFSHEYGRDYPLVETEFYTNVGINEKLDAIFKDLKVVDPDEEKEDENKSAKIVTQGPRGEWKLIKNPVKFFDIDFDLHYNTSIHAFNKRMEEWKVWDKPNNRLCILRGPMGTGKTNWIKNYIQEWDSEVIFIPPNMAAHMSEPAFLTFLMDHRGSLILIEDGEDVLEDRKTNRSSAVSHLLNITDGCLSDALDLKIIVTHNQAEDWVDEAMRRDNRCWAEYCFDKLEPNQVQRLCEELGEDSVKAWDGQAATVSEVYSLTTGWKNEKVDSGPIGFNQQ